MSIKDIKEAMEKGNVYFGIREALKHRKDIVFVYVVKDARSETIEKLEKANIEFSMLKLKSEVIKGLNLDFESEVFSIKK